MTDMPITDEQGEFALWVEGQGTRVGVVTIRHALKAQGTKVADGLWRGADFGLCGCRSFG